MFITALLGRVEMTGYVWLRGFEFARNWSDVYLEKGVSLDKGVVIVTALPLKRGKVTIRANTYVGIATPSSTGTSRSKLVGDA